MRTGSELNQAMVPRLLKFRATGAESVDMEPEDTKGETCIIVQPFCKCSRSVLGCHVGGFGSTHRGLDSKVAWMLDPLPREVAPDHISSRSSCLQNLQRYGRSIMCDLWSARIMILIWMSAKKKAQLFA